MKRLWAWLAVAVSVSAACTSTESRPQDSPGASEVPDVVLAASDCPDFDCTGSLEPGEYRASYFDPTISFQITSPGWQWHYSGNFQLVGDDSHEGLYTQDGIYFLRRPAVASQDCEEAVEPGVGRSVDDLVEWLEAAPGLVVSQPTPVTVGGFDGTQLDIQLAPDWTRTCFFSEGVPTVPLIFRGAKVGGYHWGIVPDQLMRWYVLDSGDGVLIVDIEDNPDGVPRDELLRTSGEIVDSLVFSSS